MEDSSPIDSNQDKPRRLEDETATYLAEIEQQFNAIEEDDTETRSVLVQNVLSEIQSRTASAACDRRTNYLLEKLCSYADYALILQLLQRWTVYSIFLARNRYASHVVQTIISRLCYFLKQGNLQDIDPAWMEKTIIDFAKPLVLEIQWLSREMSASHVLRSLFCLLSGLPTVAERKGKNSKHQHSVLLAEPIDSLLTPTGFCIDQQHAFTVPASFKETLMHGIKKVFNRPKRDLQIMIADMSSCACLSLLLRILTNSAIHSSGPFMLHKFYENVLEVPLPNNLDTLEIPPSDEWNTNVIYGMAGDKIGSYFLEHVMELIPFAPYLFLVQQTILPAVRDYYLDAYGNFILQAILRRLVKEYETMQISFSYLSPKALQEMKGQQTLLLQTTEALFEELLTSFSAIELIAQRMGVMFWICQVASLHDSMLSHASMTSSSSSSTFYYTMFARIILAYWQCGSMNAAIPATHIDSNGFEKVVDMTLLPLLQASEQTRSIVDVTNPLYAISIPAITQNITYFIAYHHQTTGISADGPGGGKGDKKKKKKKGGSGKHHTADGAEGGAAEEETLAAFVVTPKESQVLLLAKLINVAFTLPHATTFKTTLGQVITTLPPVLYTYLSTSSNICKLILDTFIASFSISIPGNTGVEIKQLSQQLITLGKPFAMTYIGHFLVQKIYQEIDIRGKEKWLQVVTEGMVESGNSMGGGGSMGGPRGKKEVTALLQVMRYDVYTQNRTEWKQLMKKQGSSSGSGNGNTFLAEMTTSTAGKKTETAAAVSDKAQEKKRSREKEDTAEEGGGVDEGGEVGGAGKRKRKRKRPSSKAVTAEEGGGGGDEEGDDE